MDPIRDLRAVTELLSVAFSDELGPDAQATLREMRLMAGLSPVLGVLARLAPVYDTFGGFVWEEGGAMVGNVTLSPSGRERRHWLISNLAVEPGHRRRGIARRLMEAALEAVQREGGEFLSLEVRRENLAARRLYEDLAFQYLEANAELRADSVPPASPPSGPSLPVRAWGPAEGHRVHALAVSLRPPLAQRWISLPRRAYVPGPLERGLAPLVQLLRGEWIIRRLAEEDGRVRAAGLVRLSLLGAHRGELILHPETAGRVEEALLESISLALRRARRRPVQVLVRQAAPSMIAALEGRGFRLLRILERMGLPLTPEAGLLTWPSSSERKDR